MAKITYKFMAIIAASALMSGCAAVLIGGGAAGGYVAAKNHKEISQYSSDSWITSKVKTALFTQNGLRSGRIKVVTENSDVFLMGVVSEEQAKLAVKRTRKVPGVQRVIKVFEYTKPIA